MNRFTFNLVERINAEIERDVTLANGEDEQEHAERHWPDRIERQAKAFRNILERHQPVDASTNYVTRIVCATCREGEPYEQGPVVFPCREIQDLALIFNIPIATGTERIHAESALTTRPRVDEQS